MKTLIIGGTGFLSSALVAEAQAAGHEVTIVTRGSENRTAPPPGVTVRHADRNDAEALRAAAGDAQWDLVIDAILFKPEQAREAVAVFQGRTQRYVFISTDFVYGGEPRQYPLDEDAPRQSLSAYGVNKAACEDVLTEAYSRKGFPGVTLRPPHILGVGALLGTGSLQGRDPWLLYRLREGHPILLIDGGTLLIQPVHRTDIARAALAVGASDKTPGRIYNIVSPDAVSTRRYYEMICEILGLGRDALKVAPLPGSAYLTAFPDRAPFVQNRIYSTARLTRDTGFTPSIRLRDALTEMIADLEARGLPQDKPTPEPPTEIVALLSADEERLKELLKHAA